jgi:hypothetical protein
MSNLMPLNPVPLFSPDANQRRFKLTYRCGPKLEICPVRISQRQLGKPCHQKFPYK